MFDRVLSDYISVLYIDIIEVYPLNYGQMHLFIDIWNLVFNLIDANMATRNENRLELSRSSNSRDLNYVTNFHAKSV